MPILRAPSHYLLCLCTGLLLGGCSPSEPETDSDAASIFEEGSSGVGEQLAEPLPENHTTPEQPAEISATFRGAALRLEETAEMLNTTETELNGELNATCMLRWRR